VSTLQQIADFSKVLILLDVSILMSILGVRSAAFDVRGTEQEKPVHGTLLTHCQDFVFLPSHAAPRTPHAAH
jgi:hypothetical protein